MVRIVVATVLLLQMFAAASAPASENLGEQFRDTLLRLAQAGQLEDLNTPILIRRPPERVVDLGLLVDRDDSRGLLILGTVPGGAADALGLQAGDRLIAANDVDLRGQGAGDRMRELITVWEDGDELIVDVRRGEQKLRLAGSVQVIQLPAMSIELRAASADDLIGTPAPGSSCARISTFPGAPRSRNLFPVQLLSVNGRGAGARDQESYRLPPGKVTLRIAERIDSRYFSPTANSLRTRRSGDTLLDLELELEAGVTYFLAALFFSDRSERILGGDYWQPVVWRQRGESCR
jgi:hypothetical protein